MSTSGTDTIWGGIVNRLTPRKYTVLNGNFVFGLTFS